jgi:hypothetical protein
MRVFSNYQLILLIFLFMTTIVLTKSVNHDNMDTLYDSQSLEPGFGLTSKSGKYKMDYGRDGTFNVLRIVTNKNGDVVTDRKGVVKTETVWASRERRIRNAEGPFTLEDGVLKIFNNKGDERWKKGKDDERGGSKLIMQDNGLLVLYDSDGKKIWSVPSRSPEGYENYETDIEDKRDELEKQTNELIRLKSLESNENKSRMNWSILANILWTVIATSLIYYLITN